MNVWDVCPVLLFERVEEVVTVVVVVFMTAVSAFGLLASARVRQRP